MNPSIEELEILDRKTRYICQECIAELGYWSMVHCQDCWEAYDIIYVVDCLEEMGYEIMGK